MPEACSRTFLCRAFAVTPRFTLDIASLLQVRRQAHDGARVRRRCAVLAAVLALALGALVLEQMGAEGLAPHHLPRGGHAEALLGSLMRSNLRHSSLPLHRPVRR